MLTYFVSHFQVAVVCLLAQSKIPPNDVITYNNGLKAAQKEGYRNKWGGVGMDLLPPLFLYPWQAGPVCEDLMYPHTSSNSLRSYLLSSSAKYTTPFSQEPGSRVRSVNMERGPAPHWARSQSSPRFFWSFPR